MAQKFYGFGSGRLYGIKPADPNDSNSVDSPQEFGVLQDVSISFDPSTKPLFGGDQFPKDVGRGTAKIAITAKYAELSGENLAELFFNEAIDDANGHDEVIPREVAAPAGGIYTVAHFGAPFKPLMVRSGVTGDPMRRVLTSPAAGQYTCDATTGTFTLNTGDANAATVVISYLSRLPGGISFDITNQPIGVAPVFQLVLTEFRTTIQGKRTLTVLLDACISSKLTIPTKLDDYTIIDFVADAFEGPTRVGGFSIGPAAA